MKNKSILALILLATAALTFGAISSPKMVDADECGFCSIVGPPTTVYVTVTDVDCDWAESKARAQLDTMIACPFGFCSRQYSITEACHQIFNGKWRVGMNLTYQCNACGDGGGPGDSGRPGV